MIIYNVTVKVDRDVHNDWLDWMRNQHIPEVMETGCFEKHLLSKVLVDDNDGITYSVQYTCESMSRLEEYYEKQAPALQKAHTDRYKDKFVAFRTLLEIVE